MSEVLEWALRYARHGFAVFPLAPGAKVPLAGSAGLHDATTDEATITKWFTERPDCNLGLATGAVSGITVLDCDPRHHGHLSLIRLETEHGKLTAPKAITGSGGSHWLYRYSEGEKNTASRLGEGLDTRAEGGYIVACPSRVKQPDGTLGSYRWEGDPFSELEPLPEWMQAKVMGKAKTGGGFTSHNEAGWAKALLRDGVGRGQRNDTLFRLVGYFRLTGVSHEDCLEKVEQFSEACERNHAAGFVVDTKVLGMIERQYDREIPEGDEWEAPDSPENVNAEGFEVYVKDAEEAEEIREQGHAEKMRASAENLIAVINEDPLDRIEQAIAAQGYAGELWPTVVIYLAITTRLLAKRKGAMPCHLFCLATSGSGKTYGIDVVARFFPPEAIHRMEASSQMVMIYDTVSLKHRALLLSEADSLPTESDENNRALSAIRNLLSENEMAYDFVEINPKTGKKKVQNIRRDGPTALITAGTRPFHDAQMQSRVLQMEIPEDTEKLKAALRMQARLVNVTPPEVDEVLVDFQAYLQSQAPWHVVVPFAEPLAVLIGRNLTAGSRIIRDFLRLVALVQAVAIIRHGCRERDEQGRVVAELADYEAVRRLVGPMYEAAASVPAGVRKVVVAVNAILEGRGFDDGDGEVFVAQLVKEGIGAKATVHRWAKHAVRLGYLEDAGHGKEPRLRLKPADELPDMVSLPTAKELQVVMRD